MNTLAVIDAQNDFVTGALKNDMAAAIIPDLAKYIKEWNGPIILTRDTHEDKLYQYTLEGQILKDLKHCCADSEEAYRDEEESGWSLVPAVLDAIKGKYYKEITKESFGTFDWADPTFTRIIQQAESITVVGFVSDICVISNLIILRTMWPDKKIIWNSKLSAGTNVTNHNAAVAVAKSCEIEVIE